jgi:hypothetical protein
MLDLDLPGTYLRYNSGTNTVINWPFDSALKCGYKPASVEDVSPETEKSKGTRRGGKKGKKQATATVYDIKTWEIPRLAEAVATFTPADEVPSWLRTVLE